MSVQQKSKQEKFEKYFWDTVKFLEDNKLKYMLHGSTLLRIVRNNTVIPRKDVSNDKELNFAVLAEDVSKEFEAELAKFPLYEPHDDSKYPNHLLYFGPFVNKTGSMWHTEYFNLIAKFWKKDGKRVEYMGFNDFLVFPSEMFEQPDTIEFKGHKFFTPKGPEEYLSYYFGKDYMKEKKRWHWRGARCKNNYGEVI